MAKKSAKAAPVKTAPAKAAPAPTPAAAAEKTFVELSGIFKLLCDETRLKILLALAKNQEMHVSGICEGLGMGQPGVSHHLALLRVSGLIEARRDGKHNFYSIRQEYFGEILAGLHKVGLLPDKIKLNKFTLTHTG